MSAVGHDKKFTVVLAKMFYTGAPLDYNMLTAQPFTVPEHMKNTYISNLY